MIDLFSIFDILGTVVFAISGATTAIRKEMDILGVVVLGVVTACGGGCLRDIMTNNTPSILYNQDTIKLALIFSLVTFCFVMCNIKMADTKLFNWVFTISDALGLSIFTIAGCDKVAGMYNVGYVVFFGVLTGVGGGIIRDILAGETPYVLTKHFYASSCIIGGIVYMILRPYTKDIAAYFGVTIVFVTRMLAYRYQWNLPKIRLHKNDQTKPDGESEANESANP